MNEAQRKSESDVDAGWDDVSEVPAVPTRSIAPPPDLEALDAGWSDAIDGDTGNSVEVPSVPRASLVPVSRVSGTVSLTSTPPPELDELDEGWGEDPTDEPAKPFDGSRTAPAASVRVLSKKERRKLERELRAQQQKTKATRSDSRKDSRREAAKQKALAVQARASAEREERAARKAAQRRDKTPRTAKSTPQKKPTSTVIAPRSSEAIRPLASESTAVAPVAQTQTQTQPRTVVPGWVLWSIVVALLVGVGYLVTRR